MRNGEREAVLVLLPGGTVITHGPFGLAIIVMAVLAASCSKATPTTPDVPPGPNEGPTTVEFVRASPSPGSILTGCGTSVAGCVGQVTVFVRLLNHVGGHINLVTASLHGESKIACLTATAPPVDVRPDSYSDVQLRFTTSDSNALCATPWNVVTMAVVVNGSVETLGRQEFGIRYRFER